MAEDRVAKYRLVAIGGSAGSLDVVLKTMAQLPVTLQAAVVVILHRKNAADSILVDIISAKTPLPVKEVEDKETLLPGTIYLAPPDYHLLIEDKQSFSLDSSEKVHYSRPSIDVTFESVAEIFGNAAIGILLSGANADGAAGLLKIKQAGGFTIAQDPRSADVGYMPQQAVELGAATAIVPANDLPSYLNKLLTEAKN